MTRWKEREELNTLTDFADTIVESFECPKKKKKKKTFKTERQEHFLPLDIHLCHVATKEVKKKYTSKYC